MRAVIIVFLALGTMWISAQTAPPAVTKSVPFSLKVSATADQFHLGEAIHLKISLTNITDHKVYVRRMNGTGAIADIDVFAQDGSGNVVSKSSFCGALKGGPPKDSSEPKVAILGSFQVVEVEPGQSIESSIDLGKVFDLNHTGNFRVWVERTDSASKYRVKSNVTIMAVGQ